MMITHRSPECLQRGKFKAALAQHPLLLQPAACSHQHQCQCRARKSTCIEESTGNFGKKLAISRKCNAFAAEG